MFAIKWRTANDYMHIWGFHTYKDALIYLYKNYIQEIKSYENFIDLYKNKHPDIYEY